MDILCRTKVWEIRWSNGDNVFSIVAISREGLRSVPTVITINYEGKGFVAPTKTSKSTLEYD